MARLDDLDEWIDGYLGFLKDVYYKTDPNKGDDAEISKLELARLAVERFWYLQGKLLSWAQAHLTGYCILSGNPDLVTFLEEKIGYKISEDSHILEQIGFQYNMNPPEREDKELDRTLALLEEYNKKSPGHEELMLTPHVERALIRELLMSRCADNSYWRHDLQDSLAALNEGEVDDLSRPTSGRRQGLPFSLNRWKLEALRQVRFRLGKGYKKYRALEEVGKAIGQSPEALRTWEKELEKSLDRSIDLYCSELAGQYDDYFHERRNMQGLNQINYVSRFKKYTEYCEEYDSHRGLNHFEHAYHLHKIIIDRELDEIRDRLRRYRYPKLTPESE
jgi:hypothetical protein